jgi:hypothetical protein
MWTTTIVVGCLVEMLAIGGRAWAIDQINTWERWTSPVLTSSQTMTPLQAYHDVQIEATFWRKSGTSCVEPSTCTSPDSCFKGLAFWDGDSASPGRFMIRSAFPAGTWCWKTCLLPRNGSTCTGDTGLNQSNEVTVSTPAIVTSALYSNGLLKAIAGKRNLTYWNGQTPFQWLGDTAWNAPINYASNPATWKNYVTNRAASYVNNSFAGGGGFTNVLVAPAVQTQANPPANGFQGFIAPSGCGIASPPGVAGPVVPANCHYWDSAYWQNFEKLVKDANDAGIVVVVADVMDPLNRAGSNQMINPSVKFPARADAAAFARNLAARLAGSFVVFSPSFDARVSDPTAETGITVAGLIDAVGTAIRSAAPRHLIGVHLGGGSALSDYDQFQGKPWMNLQIFQSGHGGGTCVSGVADAYAKFACRARVYALRFRCIGEPSSNATCTGSGAPAGQTTRPAVNVEGQYETPGDNETRVQTRHTGWNSGLSGSFGYNIGVFPDISAWTNPTVYAAANHLSDDDLGRMKGLFKSMPWSDLAPYHDFLVEQNNGAPSSCSGIDKANWLQLWKPHLALNKAIGYGLAYLPRPTTCTLPPPATPPNNVFMPSMNIVLNRVKANTFGINCSNTQGKWTAPGSSGFTSEIASCTEGNGVLRFSLKANTVVTCGAICDRVLVLTKKTSGGWNSSNVVANASTVDLEPDVKLSEDGQSSTVTGQVSRNGLPMGDPIPLSGTDLRFRKLPSAALDAAGNFLVVWEEENGDGTDDIVAARFNSRMEPLGPALTLNDTTDGQQAEPWVSGDDSGKTVAVWTSYSEDETIAGDIYGKVLDSSGQPAGTEFLVSTDNQGNQSMAQVQMDGDGGFVVAWTAEPVGDSLDVIPPGGESTAISAGTAKAAGPDKKRGVYYRIFGGNGQARGPERRVDSGNQGQDRLSGLEVHRHGGFRIRWHEFDATGQDQGEREQEHDRDGNPSGGH